MKQEEGSAMSKGLSLKSELEFLSESKSPDSESQIR